MFGRKSKKPKKQSKLDKAIKGKYWGIDYNSIKPEERDEVVQKALRAGISRIAGGFILTVLFIFLIIWIVMNVQV